MRNRKRAYVHVPQGRKLHLASTFLFEYKNEFYNIFLFVLFAQKELTQTIDFLPCFWISSFVFLILCVRVFVFFSLSKKGFFMHCVFCVQLSLLFHSICFLISKPNSTNTSTAKYFQRSSERLLLLFKTKQCTPKTPKHEKATPLVKKNASKFSLRMFLFVCLQSINFLCHQRNISCTET